MQHIREARHRVSHCMQGRPHLMALLQAHEASRGRLELPTPSPAVRASNVTRSHEKSFTMLRRSKPCSLQDLRESEGRVLLADSRASTRQRWPPLSRASQSVPALT